MLLADVGSSLSPVLPTGTHTQQPVESRTERTYAPAEESSAAPGPLADPAPRTPKAVVARSADGPAGRIASVAAVRSRASDFGDRSALPARAVAAGGSAAAAAAERNPGKRQQLVSDAPELASRQHAEPEYGRV